MPSSPPFDVDATTTFTSMTTLRYISTADDKCTSGAPIIFSFYRRALHASGRGVTRRAAPRFDELRSLAAARRRGGDDRRSGFGNYAR